MFWRSWQTGSIRKTGSKSRYSHFSVKFTQNIFRKCVDVSKIWYHHRILRHRIALWDPFDLEFICNFRICSCFSIWLDPFKKKLVNIFLFLYIVTPWRCATNKTRNMSDFSIRSQKSNKIIFFILKNSGRFFSKGYLSGLFSCVFDFLVLRAQPMRTALGMFSRAHWSRAAKTRTNRPSSYSAPEISPFFVNFTPSRKISSLTISKPLNLVFFRADFWNHKCD